MVTGDANDMAFRMWLVLPRRWFASLASAPILNAVLVGLGSGWAWMYALIGFTRLQARLATSQGMFVDLWAAGWFGPSGLPRNSGEADAAYIARIQANLFLIKGTRPAFVAALTPAAGYGAGPSIIEPMNASDTGGIGSLAHPTVGGGGGLDQGGIYVGSLLYPGQFFVAQPLNGQTPAAVDAEVSAALPVGVTAWTETF